MSFTRKRTEPYVKPISVEDLAKKDKDNLDKALKKAYDEDSLDAILIKAKTGFCQIWRLGDFEGIVISEIIRRDGELQLWLPLLGGRGVFKNLKKIEDAMVAYGNAKGCARIRWAGMSKGAQKVYSSRWKQIAVIFERTL